MSDENKFSVRFGFPIVMAVAVAVTLGVLFTNDFDSLERKRGYQFSNDKPQQIQLVQTANNTNHRYPSLPPEILNGGLLPSIRNLQSLVIDPEVPEKFRKEIAYNLSMSKIFLLEIDLQETRDIFEENFSILNLSSETWSSWREYTAITNIELLPAGWKWQKGEKERYFNYLIGVKMSPESCQSIEGELVFESGKRKGQPISLRAVACNLHGESHSIQTVCSLKIPVYESDQNEQSKTIKLKITRWADYKSEGGYFNIHSEDIQTFAKGVSKVENILHFNSECPQYGWVGVPHKTKRTIIDLSDIENGIFDVSGNNIKLNKNSFAYSHLDLNQNYTGIWHDKLSVEQNVKQCTLKYSFDSPSRRDIPVLVLWPKKITNAD